MTSNRKTVLITGCSAGGIGGALAEAFHEKGYHVFATARTTSKISQSLANSQNVTVLTLDVLSPDSIAAAVDSVSKKTGHKLDVLVNNSGRAMILPALDTSIEEGKKLFDLNFWAVLAMVQAFAPLLIKAQGCLVNNASVSGEMPFIFQSMYSASKAALLIAGQTWRLELAPLGVRTINLATGAVKTNAFENIVHNTVPEKSYYAGVRDFIHDLGDGRLQAGAMDSKLYASKVVREVERGSSGKLWIGGSASAARWALWLLPQSIIDRMLENMFPVSKKIAEGFGKDH